MPYANAAALAAVVDQLRAIADSSTSEAVAVARLHQYAQSAGLTPAEVAQAIAAYTSEETGRLTPAAAADAIKRRFGRE